MSGEGRAEFIAKRNVSRETLADLDTYHTLLRKWNPSINLIARSTLPQIWTRHFLDSAQVYDLVQDAPGLWADIGTGGGFPGLVAAILAKHEGRGQTFVFVEADKRKATFLRQVSAQLGLPVTVLAERIESVPPLRARILSARALAPLSQLLIHAERHLHPDGAALFQKGAVYRKELAEALENWTFRREEYTSTTDPSAAVLKLGEIQRV